MIRVLSFNVLAPHYADPEDYPPGCDKELKREYRREKILNFLSSNKSDCDIIALQEVTIDTDQRKGEYDYYYNLLKNEFYGNFVYHDFGYCDEWKKYDFDSEYGYIKCGNALFLNKNIFEIIKWDSLKLSITGNRAIVADVIHLFTNKYLRIGNIHLSSGKDITPRISEFQKLLSLFPFNNKYIDIIIGDFNNGLTISPFIELLSQHLFHDSLDGIDDKRTYSMYDRPRKHYPVDHIIYRGSHIIILPQSCVIDNDIWSRNPYDEHFDEYQTSRLKECLNTFGSDHFPIYSFIFIK